MQIKKVFETMQSYAMSHMRPHLWALCRGLFTANKLKHSEALIRPCVRQGGHKCQQSTRVTLPLLQRLADIKVLFLPYALYNCQSLHVSALCFQCYNNILLRSTYPYTMCSYLSVLYIAVLLHICLYFNVYMFNISFNVCNVCNTSIFQLPEKITGFLTTRRKLIYVS